MSLAALQVAQRELEAGVRGGDPARFRGPMVDAYLASVGLDAEHDGADGIGYPWCAAFVYWCSNRAGDPCPRTGSALHLWQQSDDAHKTSLPAPGDIFVLVHHDGIHGHCGFVESCSPAGDVVTTIEGDTDAEGGTRGDAVGRHTWAPGDGKRGRLLGYIAP